VLVVWNIIKRNPGMHLINNICHAIAVPFVLLCNLLDEGITELGKHINEDLQKWSLLPEPNKKGEENDAK